MSDSGVLARLEYEEAFGVEFLPVVKEARSVVANADSLDIIAEQISSCDECDLWKTRTRTVPGEGFADADILFVGEGPGRDEDLQGRPFVGKAGQLLDRMMGAIGLDRTNAFIANVVKCRPPGNRNPLPSEAASCLPYLRRQIEVIRPAVVCPMGSVAAGALVERGARITRIRGQLFERESYVIIPIYHPSYLLRTPSAKKETWKDLQKIQEVLEALRRKTGSGA